LANFKVPVKDLNDLPKVKFRTPQSPLVLESVRMLGAQVVSIATAELGSALETGMVDGHINTWEPFEIFKIPGRKLYITDCNISTLPATMIANLKFWNTLSPELQQTLVEIFEDAGRKISQTQDESESACINRFKADPNTVITKLPKADKARWKEKIRALYDRVKGESDESRKIVEAAERTM